MKKIAYLFISILVLTACQKKEELSKDYQLLVGTYTQKGSKGIYHYQLSGDTLQTARKETSTDSASNPSFVLPVGDLVYAVNEDENGKVQAYRLDKATGTFTFINEQETGGAHPCHLSTAGGYLFAANYTGGSLAVFPLKPDGSLAERSQLFENQGSGPVTDRQEKSHIHSSFVNPSQKELWVADLGTDEVIVFSITKSGITEKHRIKCTPGSGPRHIAFHPNLPITYVINELNNKMQVISTTDYKVIQEISTLPDNFTGTSYCADVHVSSDGRFLYGSNRLADSIVIFEIDQKSGELKVLGFEPVKGKFPRSFALSPDEKWVLVANQNSDNITVFKRNAETGLLTFTPTELKVSVPVCVKFIE